MDPNLAIVFSRHDEDKSGHLSEHELKKALEELGVKISENEVRKLLKRVDNDKSGALSLKEFSRLFDLGQLQEVFNSVDVDSSGTIEVSELKKSLKKLGLDHSSAKVMIASLDKNDDGVVDFDEFAEAFKYQPLGETRSTTRL